MHLTTLKLQINLDSLWKICDVYQDQIMGQSHKSYALWWTWESGCYKCIENVMRWLQTGMEVTLKKSLV